MYSESAAANYKDVDDVFGRNLPNIPANRLGKPEEVEIKISALNNFIDKKLTLGFFENISINNICQLFLPKSNLDYE